MADIQTLAELDRFFSRLIEEDEVAIARGMQVGLAAGAEEARQDAPRKTGNMAEGIGIDERIGASKHPIPGLASLRDFKVRITADDVSGVIGFPMEYTKYVIAAGHFDPRPAMKRTPTHLQLAVEVELAQVDGRLSA